MTAAHKFPMATVSFDLTTTGRVSRRLSAAGVDRAWPSALGMRSPAEYWARTVPLSSPGVQ